jgi:Lrp/AsnC family leucine-responsive transcriptional regulator
LEHVDGTDERILAELQPDGRLTLTALAGRVGLSVPAVRARVRRLERAGVIAGYRAVVPPAALGRPLMALVAAAVEPGRRGAFLARVRAEPAVAACHRTAGRAGEEGYAVEAHVADPAELERLLDGLRAAGARCAASPVLSSPVPRRPLPPRGASASAAPGSRSPSAASR